MSSSGDKTRGTVNEAVGRVKRGLGEATDNERLRQEGEAQQVVGEGQQVKGKAKRVIKDAVDKI